MGRSERTPEHDDAAERQRLLELRLEQVKVGIPKAIAAELEYCRLHNFPIWIDRGGRNYDANDFTRGKPEYGSHD